MFFFEERHPSKSGRHYFFPNIGVRISFTQSLFVVVSIFFVKYSFISILSSVQDAILKYTGEQQESTVRVSFDGATTASKGRKLGHKDNKVIDFSILFFAVWTCCFLIVSYHSLFHMICFINIYFLTSTMCYLFCSYSSLSSILVIGLGLLFVFKKKSSHSWTRTVMRNQLTMYQ